MVIVSMVTVTARPARGKPARSSAEWMDRSISCAPIAPVSLAASMSSCVTMFISSLRLVDG